MNKSREPKTKEEIYKLIEVGLENGYKDLTFTGGEPLIKKNDILWYFKKLEKKGIYPDITIVTNGINIDDKLLECVSNYKGKFKFNISLHSLNQEDYEQIICVTKNQNIDKINNTRFIKVIENIKKAKDRNIEVKLNFVLLKGINTGKNKIREILDFGIENNIDYIKFLELLVIEGKDELYKYFTEIEQIEEVWKDELKLVKKNIPRRKVYLYKNKLKLELQKCTCSFGCASCLKNRDVNITAELKYFPCFISLSLEEDNYPVDKENFLENVKLGNEKIIEFSKEYGNDSPLLIKKREIIEEKVEFYYKSPFDDETIKKILEDNGYKIYKTHKTIEKYYSTENEFEIKKLYMHSHNESKYTEIIQNYSLNKKNNGIIIKYVNRGEFDKPREIETDKLAEYENEIKLENSHFIKELNWSIYVYRNKNNKDISIGIEKSSNKIFVLSINKEIKSKKILEKMKLEKISKLPIKYI